MSLVEIPLKNRSRFERFQRLFLTIALKNRSNPGKNRSNRSNLERFLKFNPENEAYLECESKYEETHEYHEAEQVLHQVGDDDGPGSEHVVEGEEVEQLGEAAEQHTAQHLVPDVDHVILTLYTQHEQCHRIKDQLDYEKSNLQASVLTTFIYTGQLFTN